MIIRKNIDDTEMYAALDAAMAAEAEQMELYIRIGQAACLRTEKGAAVAATMPGKTKEGRSTMAHDVVADIPGEADRFQKCAQSETRFLVIVDHMK